MTEVVTATATETVKTTPTEGGTDKAAETPTGKPEGGADSEKRFTQADLEHQIKERLERERRKHEADRTKVEEAAKQKAMAEQGEFRKLAEERQAQIDKLEPYKTRAERYEAALNKHLETQRKELPSHIIALLDKLDVADQLEYIAANRDALVPKAPASGPPGTPKPDDGRAQITEMQQAGLEQSKARLRRAW